MKKMKKRLLALGLCLAVLFGSLTPVQVADAAAKTVKVTVRYKGKNATLYAVQYSIRKQFGKKHVTIQGNDIWVDTPPLCPMIFELKSGKVKSINWFSS